jgi:sec-independent protein translocase protein TatA
MFGQMDLVVIGGLALLFFGSKNIPDLMKGLGSGIREFKKAQSDLEEKVQPTIVNYDKPANSEEEKGKTS